MQTKEVLDAVLVSKAQENKSEFAPLYHKYSGKVLDYFWYRTGRDKDIAEDLAQETFFRAYTHLGTFRDQGYSYLSYLITIAHNVLVNYYRQPKHLPMESADDIYFDILPELEQHSDRDVLWRAVEELGKVDRSILDLKYRKELSIQEIAEMMGKSVNAVKLMLCRARKKLREQLAKACNVNVDEEDPESPCAMLLRAHTRRPITHAAHMRDSELTPFASLGVN